MLSGEVIKYGKKYEGVFEPLYQDHYEGKRFVDSQGRVFRVLGRDWLPKRFPYIFRRYRLSFEATGEAWSLEEVRTFTLARAKELPYTNEITDKWLRKIEEATTIEQMWRL